MIKNLLIDLYFQCQNIRQENKKSKVYNKDLNIIFFKKKMEKRISLMINGNFIFIYKFDNKLFIVLFI